MNSLALATSKSLLLHAIVVSVLLVGMSFSPPQLPQQPQLNAPIIQAVAIDEAQVEQQIDKIKQEAAEKKAAEDRRIKELERRAAEAEQKRKQEQQQAAELEEQKQRAQQAAAKAREKQRKEKEKAERLERERKQKELERKRAEEAARKAKEKKEQEEKALREAEQKRKREQERAEQERMLQEQLQAEQAVRNERRNKQVLTEVQKYTALITQTIQRNLIVDDSFRGKFCRLNIRLAPNGLVTQAEVLEGDAIVCRAAKAAVFKSDTLPVSPEPDVYQKLKDINLTVKPEI